MDSDGIRIISASMTVDELKNLAKERFGDMVKAVVDVNRKVMAVGGELHADEEALLLDDGSKQGDLWGVNIYVQEPRDNWLEFDSMINLRPSQGNRSRAVEDRTLREKIQQIINSLIT